MISTDPLSNRVVSAFPISIATSLALPFEEVFNSKDHYKDLKININNKEYNFIKGYLFNKCLEYGSPRIGVYLISNTINSDFYIGSTKNLVFRINNHRIKLRNNAHKNLKLQNSFNITNCAKHWFDICIIFTSDREEAFDIEQYLLDYFKDKKGLCNISTNARLNALNIPMSNNTKQKLLESNLGKKQSFDHIRKRSIQNIGRKPSKKALERLANYNANKIVSDETREKMRQVQLGKKHSNKTKIKMSDNWNGLIALKKMHDLNKKSIIIDNIKYDSIFEAAKQLKVNRRTIYNKLHNKFGIFNNYSYAEIGE